MGSSANEPTFDRPALAGDLHHWLVSCLGKRPGSLLAQGVHLVSILGSLLRGKRRPCSDSNFLLEFAPTATSDLVYLVTHKEEIAVELSRKGNVHLKDALRVHVAKAVERDVQRLI